MASSTITPSWYLSLGLLTIPVKEYVAARDVRTELKNLHQSCAEQGADAGLKMLKKCSVCDEPVPESAIVKGYKTGGGYVFLSKEEIDRLNFDKSKAMEIAAFVPWADVDPVYLGPSNWLGPVDMATSEAYSLLHQVLLTEDKAGVVKYVERGKDKVGFIRATPDALMLSEAFYAVEVRSYAQQNRLTVQPKALTPEKLQLAKMLVDASSQEWSPEFWAQFTNGYDARIQQLIADRMAGVTPTPIEAPTVTAGAQDLMAILQASLAAAGGDRKPPVKIEAPAPPAVAEAPKRRRKTA